jgi:hypothetical protein
VKHGDPCLPPGFWSRVSEDPVTGLWTWTGRVNQKGYGTYGAKRVHQMMFLASGREIPAGWHVGHTCHDSAVLAGTCPGGACEHRRCITPECLETQSPGKNVRAGMSTAGQRARQTACAVCSGPLVKIKRGERRCPACAHRRSQEATDLISQASKKLGLTWKAYTDLHGHGAKKAKQILEGATCHLAKIPGGPA